MARYTHDLMQARNDALAWGIVGAGLLDTDLATRDALAPQDSLYTLVERGPKRDSATVVGSVCGLIHASDTDKLLEAADQVRIVSLTVTEAGYGLDSATKRLDPTLPAIAADLAAPHRPRTPVGIVAEGLRRRRESGRRPFTALSCDNIQRNGAVLRGAVLDYAARLDGGLADWIDREARFPDTMVDRITPTPQPHDRRFVAEAFGVDDRAPVVSEDFRQWVIADDFADGRPDWDAVGAQFVSDVAPYERMKLRLLNASHLAVAGLGRLMGFAYIHEAVGHADVRRYMRALMDRETGPTLHPVPGVDLEAYKESLLARFANSKIRDTVDRVNADAPLNYLLDPLRDRLVARSSIDLLALALAAWMRRVRGRDEAGGPLDVRHPLAEELRRRAEEGGHDPRPLLEIRSLFGDLGDCPELVAAVERRLGALYAHGTAATLRQALAELGPAAPMGTP